MLTIHIVVSVGLLGDSAGFLAVAVRRAPPTTPRSSTRHELLGMFALFFGIPLSFLALITGIALGVGTPWGVLRYPWVVAKLVLIVTVILVGAMVLRPVPSRRPRPQPSPLIAGAAYDVAALTVATALAVFKPGRTRTRTMSVDGRAHP